MRIIVDRDAVCAGDDMNHHREEFVVPDDITIAGLRSEEHTSALQSHSVCSSDLYRWFI